MSHHFKPLRRKIGVVALVIAYVSAAVAIVFNAYSKAGIYGAVIGVLAMTIALCAGWYAERVRKRQSERHRLEDPDP